jgi:23S rRNA pseudouridine1911/1915/1917 synthase
VTRALRTDRGDAGGRLDRVLMRHLAGLPGLSRTQAQGWIAAGRVRVNGGVALRPACRLAAGDALDVELPSASLARRRPPPTAQSIPLAILYEDEHLLAVDKPAGLVVHPTGRYRDGTLVNALAWHFRAAGDGEAAPAAAGAEVRPGLVHRLDRDTSGVLLVAKSRAAHAGLARAVKARSLEKDYLAVVYGRAPLGRGRIELRLLRDPGDSRRMMASRREGRVAVTLYDLLAEAPHDAVTRSQDGAGASAWLSLLRCRLVTGRTHQIRVHLSALGLPIVGDPVYGEPRHRGLAAPALAALCREFPRQALHARRLALRHPVTGLALELVAPLPADFRRLMRAAALRLPATSPVAELRR